MPITPAVDLLLLQIYRRVYCIVIRVWYQNTLDLLCIMVIFFQELYGIKSIKWVKNRVWLDRTSFANDAVTPANLPTSDQIVFAAASQVPIVCKSNG